MNIQLTLASRYLRGRMLRTVLTTLAIVFGVLVIFGMNTMLPAFIASFQGNMLAASGRVDATITLKTGDAFDASRVGQVAAIQGVNAVSGLLSRTINLPANYIDQDPNQPDAIIAVSLVGVDPQQARSVHAYILRSGRFLDAGDAASAVISQSLADILHVNVGESFRLPSAEGETELMVVGLLPARVMPGDEEVLVTLPQAQAMLAMPGKINTMEANLTTIDMEQRARAEAAILATLGQDFQIGMLVSNSELVDNLKVIQMIFNLLGVLALAMGGFIIFNTFRTVVAERRRDIGMLRSLGANRGMIFGMILSEGLIQGLVGTLLGLGLGYLMAVAMLKLLSSLMQQFMNVRAGAPVVTPAILIGSIAMGMGVTLLAGLIPAISASKATPLEALRPTVGKISLRRMAGPGFWAGAAMIAIAVAVLFTRNGSLIGVGGVLFIIGLILTAPALINPIANLFSGRVAALFARDGTAQLAEGNLSRQPSRTAITASTTMIGMAILILAAAFISSATLGFSRMLRKSLASDFILVPPTIAVWGSNLGASAGLADQIRAVDGIAAVSTLRFAPTQINDVATSLMAIDPANYPKVSGLSFSQGDEATAYTDLDQGRNIIVNPVLASLAGLNVGDSIVLVTPTGRQTYHVIAMAGDFMNAKIATGYISHGNLAADFNRSEDVLIQADMAPGADAAAVEASLKEIVKAYPQFELVAGKQYIEDSLQLFKMAFAGLIVLMLFLAVPSVIAMVNTLAIGVLERTREIGMLRAVGATRQQVRRIILFEAVILSLIGTAFGVLAGLYLGYLGVESLRAMGFPMEFAFPLNGVVIVVAGGIVFGVLAALIPARQASRLEIVQALRYE